MKKVLLLAGVLLLLSIVSPLYAFENPIYKDGEYWIFEIGGQGSQEIGYGAYIVRRASGAFVIGALDKDKEVVLGSDYQDMLFRLMPFVVRNDAYGWFPPTLEIGKKHKVSYTYEWTPNTVYADAVTRIKGVVRGEFQGHTLKTIELERDEVTIFSYVTTVYTYSPETKSIIASRGERVGGQADGTIYTVKLLEYRQ